MGFYRIAGLPVEVFSADREFFLRRMADYAAPAEEPPGLTLSTELLPSLQAPAGESRLYANGMTVTRLADGRFCCFERTKDGRVPLTLTCHPDYSRVELRLADNCRCPQLTPTELEYMFTGDAFRCRLNYLGDGVLHSSAMAYRGQGIAFTADSGTGKSTHTGLWRQRFPHEVTVVNDDKPAIRWEGDKPWLYGTPWSGKTDLNCNMRVPLRAIVCLHRGETNSMRRLSPVEALFWISKQIARPFYDGALGEKIVDFTRRLAEQVPVYELYCTTELDAVETVRRELFE